MISILLIDDKRKLTDVHPKTPVAATVARTYQEGIEALSEHMPFHVMYLDNDLGDEDPKSTGYGIMCWLEANPEKFPQRVKVISSNPPARASIEMVLAKYFEFDYEKRHWDLQDCQYWEKR